MKKFFIAILLLFSLSVSLFSCAEKNVSLLECGNDIVSLISLMTKSNEYKTLYDLPEAYEAALSELSTADYSLPSAVYELRVPESAFIEPSINLSSVSGELKEYISSLAYTSFAARINQMSGVEALAISAAFSAQKTFARINITENTVYLFTFENGYPIAVAFIAGEGGSVRACGNFVINESLKTANEEQIKASLDDIGIAEVTVAKLYQ